MGNVKVCYKGHVPRGKLLDIIKEGVNFPIDDAFLSEYPNEAAEKLDKYKAGRKLWRKTVSLMADGVLGKIPITSKGIEIELIVLSKEE